MNCHPLVGKDSFELRLAAQHVLRGQRASGSASATLTESLPHRHPSPA